MGELQENDILSTIQEIVTSSPELARTALNALADGMNIISRKFDTFEYYVGDLIYAGEIFTTAIEMLNPVFSASADGSLADRKKVILATVEGDFHDIGKNIVKVVMETKGLQVIDLGVNVSPAAIVNKAIAENAGYIALSAVLTSAVDAMRRTVEECVSAGIRDQVTIIIGGAGVSESIAKKIKADFYGKTPEGTAALCLSR